MHLVRGMVQSQRGQRGVARPSLQPAAANIYPNEFDWIFNAIRSSVGQSA